ncbi:MBL fold metallo-hydrolase [Subdoligranulum sp. DSM 109015]|uniref:MBL fold metallo-hydrolase n=1 Tax=Gemmiger gallinarum TaxID=2779354 RepID=A0ABR9QZP5_9FIRM|nr:MBL fold metallo-hydrolase [Gemmiger gallinarum]MBE5036352.1 MBL fold metallo-hydrolase [Gemmiger gallinarum]
MNLIHITASAPLFTNTFLILTRADHGIVIDPAADASVYLRRIEQENARLTHILLTHGHYDHVGAVVELQQKTGAAVYVQPEDTNKAPMFPLPSIGQAYPEDGILKIDELEFHIWRTPGHTPGSVCLYCDGVLFSGDTLFAGSCGRVDLPGGSAADMRNSLSLLAKLPLPGDTKVLPGHEYFSTLGEERRHNPYLLGEWY